MNTQTLLQPIRQFLHCQTPEAWINEARKPENLSLLLTDHLVCELKAALTATWLIRKYVADKPSGEAILDWLKPYEAFVYREMPDPDFIRAHKGLSRPVTTATDYAWAGELVEKMMLLIKEELHHFYQVWEIMQQRGIAYQKMTASRYAKSLMREVITHEPMTLVDKLICGAYIEARSCERFAALAPYLDPELAKFYTSLLRSEARHYQDYLHLAQQIAEFDISARVQAIGRAEAILITSPDPEFRFHSGCPIHL
ncbi:tRNA isopentenyl-2-thiomethyl-A-37 hydroxylase MiaE [Rosenbergiella nectarea]|uniref:tRNA isopentenyl-2-thiomethyl-A-37 hydroxylase MiaE n=1 Tax=Rosenbergiella nectarea TaxID=988801 RepID=UPI001BDB5F2A|nr:tRNA isopentenyl-2-thiomethyl-A-37 hydroxylase MiaE [Rosenbergiella nectarea]MBT0728714.1 tRNA-(ms[2]io[6]A)-hydroxylase [Rosenbergiella nectarea subsp. apis]